MLSSILSKLSLSTPTTPEASFPSSLKFTSCLGQGGFGIVFKVVDANPSSSSQTPPTAVKFIFPEESNQKEQQQILRECELAATFSHDNIVKILKVEVKQLNVTDIEKIFKILSEDDEKSLSLRDTCIRKAKRYKTIESICIQMPLCGENLRKWLQLSHNKNNPKIQILQIKIGHGIVSGLKYLHDKKIVHRDLKPENVMFSHEKFHLPVKIGDFGLCRNIHSPESQTSSLTSRIGTLEYMAPEAFTNDYSFQADLFSLGLVIWEVFQLIKFHDRKPLFDKLVNDKKEDLVGQMSATGVREIVLSLTRRNKMVRMRSVDEIVVFFNALCQPHTSYELKRRLEYVANGGRIVLGEGTYEGKFVLEQDNVEIVGAGGGRTVLKGLKNSTCLVMKGNGCKISDIKVISGEGINSIAIDVGGSENAIQNLKACGGSPCLRVCAENSKLVNLTITDAVRGIHIIGCRHIVDHVKMDNICRHGIKISAYQNSISNITGTNVGKGIWVGGSSNNFSNIALVKMTSSYGSQGMYLFDTFSNNTVSNFTCSGFSRKSDDWGLKIDSPSTTVKDSNCGPVWVRGINATLTNVDCGEKIEIRRAATGANLTKCRGQEVILHVPKKEVTTRNCNFDKIIQR